MRPARVWLVFAACAAALLGAMVWISLTVLRLERAEQQARAQAALEENTRLALWRLDSALMPLLAQEAARPSAPLPADPGGPPSPVRETPPEVLLHFQIAPGGEITSPQKRTERLDSLRAALRGADLAAQLPRQPPAPPANVVVAANDLASVQKMKNVQEYQARQQSLTNSVTQQALVVAPRPPHPAATTAGGWLTPREGAPAALWVGDALLLARRVGVGDAVYVQGSWLDWPRLRADLLASIQDLLPGAALEPVAAGARPDEERRLATLPVRLVTGPAPVEESSGPSPVRLSLAGAWAFAFLAALAVAALLRGVVELSERRHVFVSAVTHELRTPLTTFRLYTDMLADGMITEEARRREYIARLRGEAERLGHLVENVLFYARVESGRGEAAREVVDLQALLEEARPRLAERAARADLELSVATRAGGPAAVHVDRSAVEQVLLNLVDNACKYASRSTPPRIDVEVETRAGRALLRVRDHGPGLSATERRRLFQPFSKSDRDAANSAPGIGLGLALSRRLARAQGGDLALDTTGEGGAVFVLSLPLARSG
ncbi:MAG TPA: HAMP domain-containing sensor histidine kinase [Vicinamibacteria bacterium]|nr:HAMP domain-containing sensor histidine kinase [Vicinamibacteria bacterium]